MLYSAPLLLTGKVIKAKQWLRRIRLMFLVSCEISHLYDQRTFPSPSELALIDSRAVLHKEVRCDHSVSGTEINDEIQLRLVIN